MIGVLILASLPFVIDGGDVEQAQCAQAVAEVQESRRLLKNTLVTLGLNTVSHGLDLASTEWAESKYACRNTVGAQVCTFETNVFTPTSLGRFAVKAGIVIGVTGLSYLADRRGHRVWAQIVRWLGVAGGLIPAAWNIHKGLQVEQARAGP